MIELWRSEEMQLVQLIIPTENAHNIVEALGEIGQLQFKDLNSEKNSFQRTYANQIKRCEEMSRKLRYFKEQLDKTEQGISPGGGFTSKGFDELESKLEELEQELLDVTANSERLEKSKAELSELQLVLEKAGSMFEGVDVEGGMDTSGITVDPSFSRIGNIAGLVDIDKVYAFERLLFRATRGNMFLRTSPVGMALDPTSGEKREKAVYVVFFAGERARTKINKICDTFQANRYPFPEDQQRQQQMRSDVYQRLTELQSTIDATDAQKADLLGNISDAYESWLDQVRREKGIFYTMNKLSVDVSRNVLVGEAWLPVDAKRAVQDALSRGSSSVQGILQPKMTKEAPPTYFKTDKFTSSFQAIVDAYGTARYREMNAGVFTIITFPFLFAVMFGDVGHGILLLAYGLLLVAFEGPLGRSKLDEIVGMTFGGRYLILLMGIFSVFAGFIYNEAFAIPLTTFGDTHFQCIDMVDGEVPDYRDPHLCHKAFDGDYGLEMEERGSPYPFGIDPVWHGTRTELTFTNSLKMKMAILLGVLHMNLGIIGSLWNHLYWRDFLSILSQFIPQMLFLNSIFGYLCFIIVYKWVSIPALADRYHAMARENFLRDDKDGCGPTYDESAFKNGRPPPPDIYHILIYMFLEPANLSCYEACDPKDIADGCCPEDGMQYACPENDLFPGQQGLQIFLVLIALASVPVMLVVKPLVLRHRFKKAHTVVDDQGYGVVRSHASDELPHPVGLDSTNTDHLDEEKHFEFGEVFVEQMIHTIEFVLGGVSNTASYLRLWALSLAHAQLSAVFYDQVLMRVSQPKDGPMQVIMIVVAGYVWVCATLGVLMLMESLSAFLHALRLHWVEYQNKFFHADGYKFVPFTFKSSDDD